MWSLLCVVGLLRGDTMTFTRGPHDLLALDIARASVGVQSITAYLRFEPEASFYPILAAVPSYAKVEEAGRATFHVWRCRAGDYEQG